MQPEICHTLDAERKAICEAAQKDLIEERRRREAGKEQQLAATGKYLTA